MAKKKLKTSKPIDRAMDIDVLDVERLVRVNAIPEVTNPLLFNRYDQPTEGGLLSYTIFGLPGSSDRSERFGYIDLGEKFITPQVFYNLTRLKAHVKDVIWREGWAQFKGGNLLKITEDEYNKLSKNKNNIVGTGFKFILKNIDKLNLTKGESHDRDVRMALLKNTQDASKFISKCIIIPAMYRDISFQSRGKNKSDNDVNKIYASIIRSSQLLKSGSLVTEDTKDVVRSRIQTGLMQLYRLFLEKAPKSSGFYQNYVFGKNVDYSGLGVLSAPPISGYDKPENTPIDISRSGVPLSHCLSYYYLHIERWVTRYMENLLGGARTVVALDLNTLKHTTLKVDETAMNDFSGDLYKKRCKKYVKSYYTRLDPVSIKCVDSKGKTKYVNVGFITAKRAITINSPTFIDDCKDALDNEDDIRNLTWTDLFYMAAYNEVEVANLPARITRYPLKDHMNTIITYVHIVSMDTTNKVINGIDYPYYPDIKPYMDPESISILFSDALQLAPENNSRLVADHDGDTAIVIPLWSQESKAEADEFIYSKRNMITLEGKPIAGIPGSSTLALSYLSM